MMRVQVVADDPASPDLTGVSSAAGNLAAYPAPIGRAQIDIPVHPLAGGEFHTVILAQKTLILNLTELIWH